MLIYHYFITNLNWYSQCLSKILYWMKKNKGLDEVISF